MFQSLFSLLQSKNINTITVTEICKIAKVNRSTFYKHFKHVDALFFAYIDFVLLDLESKNEEQLTIHLSKLNIQTTLFIHVIQYETFYKILFAENMPLKFMNYYQKSIQVLSFKIVPSYVVDTFNKDLYFSLLAGAVCSSIKYWLENKLDISTELMNSQLHRFFTVN